jgi:hypothetical protein
MTAKARTLMAAAVATATAAWGGAAGAATEQIVCQQQDPSRPAMNDCVLISPAAQSSATGAGASSPNAVTYQVVEPIKRDTREVVVAPEQSVVVAERAAEVRQPSAPQPYPAEWSPRSGAPEVRYVVAERAVPAAAPSEVVVVPAQRIFVTEPAPFPSASAPPWPD